MKLRASVYVGTLWNVYIHTQTQGIRIKTNALMTYKSMYCFLLLAPVKIYQKVIKCNIALLIFPSLEPKLRRIYSTVYTLHSRIFRFTYSSQMNRLLSALSLSLSFAQHTISTHNHTNIFYTNINCCFFALYPVQMVVRRNIMCLCLCVRLVMNVMLFYIFEYVKKHTPKCSANRTVSK